jgi:NitT/TauT family transport system permease protein
MAIFMRKLTGAAVLLFWIALWQAAGMIIANPLILPTPVQAVSLLFKLLPQADFWRDIGHTLFRVAAGLSLSIVAGVLIALLAHKSGLAYHLIRPIMSTVKTVPVMSLILLFLVFMRSPVVPVAICVMACLPIVFTNIYEALNNVDKKLIEMGKTFGLSAQKTFFKVIAPQIKPYFSSAVMLCAGFSWKTVVTAEVLSIPASSIGFNLYLSKTYLDTPLLFAWTIAIIVISVIIEKAIKAALRGDRL